MAIKKSEEWIHFIRLYKNLPELWNVKHEHYKNKYIRGVAYERLLVEYQNIDENSTVETVKNRIRNMRIAYKRELRKKISNERNDAVGVELMYEPNLWYFNELDFLKELELPEDGITVKLSSDDECISPIPIQIVKRKRSSERNELRRISVINVEHLNKKKREEEADKSTYNKRNELQRKTQIHKENVYKKERNQIDMKAYNESKEMPHSSTVHKETVNQKEWLETEMNSCNERNELLRKATMYMENLSKKERDEADIYAEGWAHSYRKLSESQRLYAKKACDDIFILGQLGKLHFNIVNVEETPSYQARLNVRYPSDSSLDEMN